MTTASRKILKWTAWIIGLPFALILTLLLVWVICNRFDEKLTPEAQALLDYAQKQALPPEKQNSFYAMLGFKAGSGQDPWQSGKQYWQQLDQHWKTHAGQPLDATTPAIAAPEGLALPDLPSCQIKDRPCLFFWGAKARLSNPVSLIALENQYAEVLQRYRTLRSYPHFATPILVSNAIVAPFASVPAQARHLWLLATGFRLSEGMDVAATLDDVAADLRFWIARAQDADNLVNKMLAFAYLRQNYTLLADVAYSNPDQYLQHQSRWDALLAAPPAVIYDLAEPFRYEKLVNVLLLQSISNREVGELAPFLPNLIGNLFYLPNASINQAVVLRANWGNSNSPQTSSCENWPTYFYNPIGKVLNCIGMSDMASYAQRMQRTEAVRRLLIQYLTLLRENANLQDAAAIKQRLARFDITLQNPLDQTPARYNADTGELFFDWPQHNNRAENVSLLINQPKQTIP